MGLMATLELYYQHNSAHSKERPTLACREARPLAGQALTNIVTQHLPSGLEMENPCIVLLTQQ